MAGPVRVERVTTKTRFIDPTNTSTKVASTANLYWSLVWSLAVS